MRLSPTLAASWFASLVLVTATARPSLAAAFEHELSTGAVAFVYRPGLLSTPTYIGGSLAYHLGIGPNADRKPLRLSAGMRLAGPFTTVPLEGYIRIALAAQLGVWRPWAGPEVGASGLSVLPPSSRPAKDQIYAYADDEFGPGYIGFAAAPLRFAFGAWRISALEVLVGASFPPLGAGGRLQLGLVDIGLSW